MAELIEFDIDGFAEDEDARFVYLEDCKHVMEVRSLTRYMEMELEEGIIATKACPWLCGTVIQARRFGNVVRRQVKNVMAVKKMVFGNQEIIQWKQEALLEQISSNVEWINILGKLKSNVRGYFLDKLAYSLPPSAHCPTEAIKPRKVDAGTMQSLEVIAKYGQDFIQICKDAQRCLRKEEFEALIRNYSGLFENLINRELPLTKTEIENFENEFDRMYDIGQVYKRRAAPTFTAGHPTATQLYTRAENLVYSPRVYSGDIKKQLRLVLEVSCPSIIR